MKKLRQGDGARAEILRYTVQGIIDCTVPFMTSPGESPGISGGDCPHPETAVQHRTGRLSRKGKTAYGKRRAAFDRKEWNLRYVFYIFTDFTQKSLAIPALFMV
ncbi:MAG: hypothetical protein IJ480_12230 [Clostridia bacterium]|nr:hypothetical protein [Clostridia bacterium]